MRLWLEGVAAFSRPEEPASNTVLQQRMRPHVEGLAREIEAVAAWLERQDNGTHTVLWADLWEQVVRLRKKAVQIIQEAPLSRAAAGWTVAALGCDLLGNRPPELRNVALDWLSGTGEEPLFENDDEMRNAAMDRLFEEGPVIENDAATSAALDRVFREAEDAAKAAAAVDDYRPAISRAHLWTMRRAADVLLTEANMWPQPDPPPSPGEEWSVPTTLKELSARLGEQGKDTLTPDMARTILEPYGLKQYRLNRQSFTVRLDKMPTNIRQKVEGKR